LTGRKCSFDETKEFFFSIDKSARGRITKGLLSALNEFQKNLCHNGD
jgi:hypothetical protein